MTVLLNSLKGCIILIRCIMKTIRMIINTILLAKLNTGNRTMVVGASVKAGGVLGGGEDYCGKCDVAARR